MTETHPLWNIPQPPYPPTISYGYDTPYDNYSLTKYALPPSEIEIHPDSAAAQLGYTSEDMVERWYREEYLPELEAEIPHQQQQHSNNTQSPPAPTTHLEPERKVYEGYGIANEHPIATTSHDNDDGAFECEDSPATWYQPPTTTPEGARAPREHDVGITMVDCNMHVASFKHYKELDNGATNTEPDHDTMIEQLARKVFASGNTDRNWAEEMEQEMGLATQGEYTPANYSPTTAPPPPAPLHPPPPPTLSYMPPRPYYKPYRAWLKPPWNCYMAQHPSFRPYTRPQREWRPPCGNRNSHVTATRHERFCTTTHVECDRLPRYVPPALRDITETSKRSQPPQIPSKASFGLQKSWCGRSTQNIDWLTSHGEPLGICVRTRLETQCALSPLCSLLGGGYLWQGHSEVWTL